MSLSSEMLRITADFAATRARRRKDVAAIRAAARRVREETRRTLNLATAAHKQFLHTALAEIKADVAYRRGKTQDHMGEFQVRRKAVAFELRHHLAAYAADLERNVEGVLGGWGAARVQSDRKDSAARESYLRGVRRRVRVLRSDQGTSIAGLRKDRLQARRTWRNRGRAETAAIQGDAAARAPRTEAPSPTPAEAPAPVPVPAAPPKPARAEAPPPARVEPSKPPQAEASKPAAAEMPKAAPAETPKPVHAEPAKPPRAKVIPTARAEAPAADGTRPKAAARPSAPKKMPDEEPRTPTKTPRE